MQSAEEEEEMERQEGEDQDDDDDDDDNDEREDIQCYYMDVLKFSIIICSWSRSINV